ncbi:MAG TPA: zf-HC2 domain-containing protein [Anaerolineae bacterium]|nr:zf-HC2 domain-containing protein [Anaerolineae bacterium]
MDHEQSYALMMDALDGVISNTEQETLNQHLLICNDCRYEWESLQAIDFLFMEAPMVEPPPNFVQTTMAQLPNYRLRVWTASFAYLFLLLGGLIPALGMGFFSWQLVTQPVLVGVIGQTAGELLRIGQILFNAFFQIMGSTGDLLGQYPAIPGMLFIMLGSIALWISIYERAFSPQWAFAPINNNRRSR